MEHFQLQVQLTLNQFLDFKTTSGLDSFSVPGNEGFRHRHKGELVFSL